MKAWVDCQRRREEAVEGLHLVKDGFHFADWLALDNPQPGPFGATAELRLPGQEARVLGCGRYDF